MRGGVTERTQRTARTAACATAMIAAIGLATAAEANVGDHFTPLGILSRGSNGFAISPADNSRNDDLADEAAVRGATLLAATSAGGPVVAFLTLVDAVAFLNGPPPGNYWLLMVVGHTTAHNAPASAWTQFTVANTCVGPPGAPTLSAQVTGSTVRLDWNGGTGCGWDTFRLEAGTTPGGVELGTIPLTGLSTVATGVPTGTYYLRIKAVNGFGPGAASRELPVSVPSASCQPPTPAVNGSTALVQGNAVTVRWNPPPTGPAPTFYQVLIKERFPVPVDQNRPVITGSFIVPASVTSLSGVVPNGGYRIQILAGNACRTALPLGIDLFFNVP